MSNMNSYHLIIRLKISIIVFLCVIPVSAAQDLGETEEASPDEALIRLQSNIIGDKEQPSVSYFIPWKGIDSPDGLRWEVERRNDDTLGIVDRDIMRRSMTIYNRMNFEADTN